MKILLHFSEEPDIARFVPRAPRAHPEQEPRVWAIDEDHAFMYLFPRDCPRVTFWPLPTSTDEDIARFLGHTAARRVAAIEGVWLERIREARLFVYRMPAETFTDLNDAGMHVSRATVAPLSVEPAGDLLTRLRDAGVEVRLTPSLWPLYRAVIASTLHFSIIRLRNARPEETAAL